MSQPSEVQLMKRLVDTAAALGKILHRRGGHVYLDIKMAGPKAKRRRRRG